MNSAHSLQFDSCLSTCWFSCPASSNQSVYIKIRIILFLLSSVVVKSEYENIPRLETTAAVVTTMHCFHSVLHRLEYIFVGPLFKVIADPDPDRGLYLYYVLCLACQAGVACAGPRVHLRDRLQHWKLVALRPNQRHFLGACGLACSNTFMWTDTHAQTRLDTFSGERWLRQMRMLQSLTSLSIVLIPSRVCHGFATLIFKLRGISTVSYTYYINLPRSF